MMKTARTFTFAILLLTAALNATADEATFSSRSLTVETALKAAHAALNACRDAAFNVSVAVVDKSGIVQVVLRDRLAGSHTPDTATGKAWTAVSFRSNTSELIDFTASGRPENGIRHLPRVVMVGGGMIVQAAGEMVAGIGVSGAPSGAEDEKCAKAGIAAIQDSLDF
jgi:uncharacterized protein GlcG (DUF336 family)